MAITKDDVYLQLFNRVTTFLSTSDYFSPHSSMVNWEWHKSHATLVSLAKECPGYITSMCVLVHHCWFLFTAPKVSDQLNCRMLGCLCVLIS